MNAAVRVLVVDDQEPFRDAARMVVDMTDGFEVVGEASDGAEAVSLAVELRPDLVLIDVVMPVMDGIEATRRLRAEPGAPHVIVFSTHESGNHENPALEAGASAFVAKSAFSMDVLEVSWREISRGS